MSPSREAPPTVAVRWRPFRLPMRHRFEAAHGALEDRTGVLLELHDAAGALGLGEASPMPSLGGGSVEEVLALLRSHARGLLGGGDTMLFDALPVETPGLAALRCAIDVALLDLEGRRAGVPVAALLSDTPADRLLVNAIVGGGAPDEVVAYAREAVAAGYEVLKLKVGVGELERDVAIVAAVREACPHVTLRLDANGAWDERTAAEAVRRVGALGVELIEQPVPATEVEALARLRSLAPMRLAADEALTQAVDRERVLKLHAADVLVLKPMLLGGIRPALALARRAAESGIGSFVTTTFDSSIGTAASLHLAAALPWDAAQGLGTGEHLADDLVCDPLRPAQGWLTVPSPGLGVAVDPQALDRLAIGDWAQVTA